MRIKHRVTFRRSERIMDKLNAIDISYGMTDDPPGSKGIVFFDIHEDDSRWPSVRSLVDEYQTGTTCWTEFTTTELRSASWLEMLASWHHGYPMPDDDFRYLNETYDLTDYCEECGIVTGQKAPFRMRGEPKWGKKGILQLNWVFDEFFVIPDVWESVFKPVGFDCRAVLSHRTGRELKTVVQLRVDTILGDKLDMQDHRFDVCPHCNRKKYLPFSRGMFPAMTVPPDGVHAVKSEERFGSGASAHRAFLVSQAVYRAVSEAKVKGVGFHPLAERGHTDSP